MRLCANENVPGDCVDALRRREHGVRWVRETSPGSSDDQVLSLAQNEQRLLLTFDKDFGERRRAVSYAQTVAGAVG